LNEEMNLIKKLNELQDIDLELKDANSRLAKVNSLLADDEVMSKLKSSLAEISVQMDALKTKRKDIEYETEDLRKNVSQISGKLYGGKINASKELMDLEKDLKGLQPRLKEKEDKLLELMDAEEALNKQSESIAKQVKEREITREKENSELTAQKNLIENRIADLAAMRTEQLQEIDAESVKDYDRVTARKGCAVVRVEQGRCKGCRISLSMNELQRARAGALVHCSSCGKILFME
jgi:uncharacterized protein